MPQTLTKDINMKYIILILLIIPAQTFSYSIQEQARIDRIESCEKYWDHSITKCATMMTLVYAYESWFWKSRRCVQDKNCFGMKWNWYDTPAWFLKFNTYQEWNDYFAKKFYQWHYKKSIEEFVYTWSMTERETYIKFIKSKYNTVYEKIWVIQKQNSQIR